MTNLPIADRVLEPTARGRALAWTLAAWAQRYMSPETLARVTDNPGISLPAVAV